jgi:hypothetical protein
MMELKAPIAGQYSKATFDSRSVACPICAALSGAPCIRAIAGQGIHIERATLARWMAMGGDLYPVQVD